MEAAAASPATFSKDEAKAKAVDMLDFINAAWTPYHAVEEASRRLMKAGFQHIAEKDAWKLKPGMGSSCHCSCIAKCT
jgi:aspartyl aminopeptidase